MSQFATLISQSIFPALMELHQVPGVTYERKFEDDMILTALVGPVHSIEVADEDGIAIERGRTLAISRDPDSEWNGVATLNMAATFGIGGELWRIDRITKEFPGITVLELIYAGRKEVTRADYRQK